MRRLFLALIWFDGMRLALRPERLKQVDRTDTI